MGYGRNNENVLHQNEHFLPQEKNYIVPVMQHGRPAKPLLAIFCCHVNPGRPTHESLSHYQLSEYFVPINMKVLLFFLPHDN